MVMITHILLTAAGKYKITQRVVALPPVSNSTHIGVSTFSSPWEPKSSSPLVGEELKVGGVFYLASCFLKGGLFLTSNFQPLTSQNGGMVFYLVSCLLLLEWIPRAHSMPRALSSVSWYSCPGSEAATSPPPTLKYATWFLITKVRITTLKSEKP